MKTWPRRILWSVGLVALIGVFVVAFYYYRLASYPDYWSPPLPDAAMVERADALERQVVTNLSRPREPDTWDLRLTAEQMNEWLAARLPQWLANQGVDPEVRALFQRGMVHLNDGDVELAVEAQTPAGVYLVRFVLDPTDGTGADDPARLALTDLYIGTQPVSRDMALGLFADRLTERQRAELVEALDGFPLVHDLGDGRTVTVERVEIDAEAVTLRCRTRFVGRSGGR